jgi:hypothetical protein
MVHKEMGPDIIRAAEMLGDEPSQEEREFWIGSSKEQRNDMV